MVGRPLLLDLFCGAGGAAMGYHRAGFDVVGVDIDPQPHYPFTFVQGDALDPSTWMDATNGREPVLVHASPPCQAYSAGAIAAGTHSSHPDMYAPTRELLRAAGAPYVIENVLGAPYSHGFVLCGSMFGLPVRRHRNFECSELILVGLRCDHSGERPVTITGRGGRVAGGIVDYAHSRHAGSDLWPGLMGMPWASPQETRLAIPPAYTEWIGGQLIARLEVVA